MAKAKAEKASRPAKNPLEESVFLDHIRQSAITATEGDDAINTSRAETLLANLPDETVAECCEAAGIVHEPHGVGGRIIDFIRNIDPAKKKFVIDLLLGLIGVKTLAPQADAHSTEDRTEENGEIG